MHRNILTTFELLVEWGDKVAERFSTLRVEQREPAARELLTVYRALKSAEKHIERTITELAAFQDAAEPVERLNRIRTVGKSIAQLEVPFQRILLLSSQSHSAPDAESFALGITETLLGRSDPSAVESAIPAGIGSLREELGAIRTPSPARLPTPEAVSRILGQLHTLFAKVRTSKSDLHRIATRYVPTGTTFTWDDLITHVEQLWRMPESKAFEQLLDVIRHAVFDPSLVPVGSGAELLKRLVEPHSAISEWAQECQRICAGWIQEYYALERECVGQSSNLVLACQCILQRMGPLFSNSSALLERGAQIGEPSYGMAKEVYRIVMQGLSGLTRTSLDLASQDMSWLADYIDEEERRRRDLQN